ncbi:pleiotropic drug resistance protein 3-like isoform X2 [Nymphaea colorata]|uniref:pleiotropic drug resistance protein 3-like isoform X2 n=1 Tax=Nymphaea colorata TaxID=210225 RepID=UPI00129DC0B4|nr:pleiotropic drug resistance protein 3-like isoform X2 [Nymphaea colorata]
MAQLAAADDAGSLRVELAEIGRSLRSSFRNYSSFRSESNVHSARQSEEDEELLHWAAIERLPTFERLRTSVFYIEDDHHGENNKGKRVVDVTDLGAIERHLFIEKLIKDIEEDNRKLLSKLRKRLDKVGIKLPTVEVRYKNLSVDAKCEVVDGKPLPTLWNATKSIASDLLRVAGLKPREANISVIKDVSGIIKPSRLTLLMGPPGCGKTTLLLALAGRLDKSQKLTGDISYNQYRLDEFVPQKTSAYISQYDLHIPEMTVRETLDFSARCQGVGKKSEMMAELHRREKQAGIIPDHDIDVYMKATSIAGSKRSLQTDYILKILGLDICSDTIVGDVMRTGISGGQKKRLTTDATVLISLLQPAPETFDVFDDLILMAEGKIVYHGPRVHALQFFEDCGFKCPQRKGASDFLQEVLSRKDQAQYWFRSEPYAYVSVNQFVEKFKASDIGQKLSRELLGQLDESQSHKDAVSFSIYSLSKWELLKACMSREMLLVRRNSFVYIFKTVQLSVVAIITMTVYLHTKMHVTLMGANNYMGSMFFSIMMLIVNGFPELGMTVLRLPVFHKQRDFYLYPAWAYTLTAAIWKIPHSLIESFIWTGLTYYVIGYSPEIERFLRQFLLLFAVHQFAASLCRFLASITQTLAAAFMAGISTLLAMSLFGGFLIPRSFMPVWLKWGFWISPLTYAQIGISGNEFLAPRWREVSSANTSVGHRVLTSSGLDFPGYFYWVSVGALFGFTILLNVGFTLALTYMKSAGRGRAIISREKLSQLQEKEGGSQPISIKEHKRAGNMVLPFEPLSIVFQDVQYFVDTPQEMRNQGVTEKKLQLLKDITGAFRPGVLTALMGVSGAGKTTLMDVLSGRKTGGIIEGNIWIGGYPKVQETFARVSGYCEQTDIHSPQITVEESVIYSAWLRLAPEIDQNTKREFINEVLETIELDGIKDALVGIPGLTGLSTEQRKRLTITVELVANPSIIFLDEPTSGLDARAAAIVMRAVKNVVHTGRTVVCTIHQPSIDIFESFDELMVMKPGGQIIYAGSLGRHSSHVIQYFQGISGIPRIKDNYNPATWMLEVTTNSMERQLNIDFARLYEESSIYQRNKELVKQLSTPSPGSNDLSFQTVFPQNDWGQFKACLWKQYLSYWRNPSYNLSRIAFVLITSFLFAALFWKHGQKIHTQQDLFTILGLLFSQTIFLAINSCMTVHPVVATERIVMYRERFAGMYSAHAYSLAQVAIEIPCALIQAVLFWIITYPSVGYYWTAYKIFWYIFSTFSMLLYSSYLGMLVVSLTPNVMVAAILQSVFSIVLTLFSGFLIPGKQIPKWWIWLYWINPTNWTLRGLFTSQYGDIEKEIDIFGEKKAAGLFLKDYFGFRHDQLGVVAAVLVAYCVVFAFLFAYCISKLNFQRR